MTIRINLVESIFRLNWDTDKIVSEAEVRLSTFHSSSTGVTIRAQPTGKLIPLMSHHYSWRDYSMIAAGDRDPEADAAKLIAREILEYAITGQIPRRGFNKLTYGPVMGLGVMDLADTIRALVKATDEGQLTRE